MSDYVNAIISGYVGDPKPKPESFNDPIPQYSVKIGLDNGSDGWVNADVGSREAELLLSLDTGDGLIVERNKKKTGGFRYSIFVPPAPAGTPAQTTPVGTPRVAAPPPGAKKTPFEDKADAAMVRYDKVLDRAILLVTSVSIASELDLSDAQIFENARAIATHINIDL